MFDREKRNIEETKQVNTKKPIKWPILSISGDRNINFLTDSGNNSSLEKNSRQAPHRINIKKVKWWCAFTSI